MPRNNQGVYTLPAGNPVVPGTLIETTWANPTMSDIAAALTGSLPRDGSAGMTGPLILSTSNPTNSLEAASKAYVQSFMVYATGMPVGAAMPFLGNSPPPGFLICDGQAVSRTTYAELFAVIGTIYGAGDGVSTFNVPDLRNQFIRGKADDRAVGSTQAGSFAAHTHPVSDPGHTHANTAAQAAHTHTVTTVAHSHGVSDPGHLHQNTRAAITGGGSQIDSGGSSLVYGDSDSAITGISIQSAAPAGTAASQQPAITLSNATSTTGETIGSTGGAETVPQNMALIYVVKAVNDTTQVGAVTSISSSDTNMISINEANPVVPELVLHSNVAFGMVKLDASGKVPLNQIPQGAQQLIGFFDALPGLNPSEAYPLETFSSGDTYIISVAGTINCYDPVTLTTALRAVVVGSLLQYVSGSLTNPTGWYTVTQSGTMPASSVVFTPSGGVTSTNVQDAIVEVQGNIPTTASQIANVPAGGLLATNVQAALNELEAEISSIGAPAASGVTFVPSGSIGATDVQAAIQELDNEKAPLTASTATGTSFVPAGTIAATNVQAAIQELDNETQASLALKAALASPAFTGNPTAPTPTAGDNDTSIATTAFVTAAVAAAGGGGPAFYAFQSASQTPSAGSTVKVLLQSELFDTDNAFDTAQSRFQPTVAGYYQINGAFAPGATTQVQAIVYKNGAVYSRGANGGNISRSVVSTLVHLNGSTDYVELWLNVSTSQASTAGVDSTYMNGSLVKAD
jgi:microcystin-dependent protein